MGNGKKIKGDKLLAGTLYVVTMLCILAFIGQSIAGILLTK